jgi:hypothetical protein
MPFLTVHCLPLAPPPQMEADLGFTLLQYLLLKKLLEGRISKYLHKLTFEVPLYITAVKYFTIKSNENGGSSPVTDFYHASPCMSHG